MDFIVAESFVWEEAIVEEDWRDLGEIWFRATGPIGSRLYRMVYTMRGEVTRIITLRLAEKNEVIRYVKANKET